MSTTVLAPAMNGSLLDAAGRFRVSNPTTRFSSKLVDRDQTLLWSSAVGGGGTVSYVFDFSAVQLQLPAGAPGASAVRQTKQYVSYQPGKSQLVDATFQMNATVAGLLQRVGYFDTSDGLFFENNGNAASNQELAFVVRTSTSGSPVDTRYPRAAWNLDKLDGSGPSGLTLNPLAAQLLVIDFIWLGLGDVRFGFYIDGQVVYCLSVPAANISGLVFMRRPSLPVRYEISCTAPLALPATLNQICCSIASEGGVQNPGMVRSIFRNVGTSIATAAFEPVLSIRLNPGVTTIRSTLFPEQLSIGTSSTSSLLWAIVLNPVVAGGAAPVWVDVPASAAQYDVTADGTVDPLSSVILASGFLATQQSGQPIFQIPENLPVAADIAGTPDVLMLCARPDAGTETFFGSLSWRELN